MIDKTNPECSQLKLGRKRLKNLGHRGYICFACNNRGLPCELVTNLRETGIRHR